MSCAQRIRIVYSFGNLRFARGRSLTLIRPTLMFPLAVSFEDRSSSSQTCNQDCIISIKNPQHLRTKSCIVSIDLLRGDRDQYEGSLPIILRCLRLTLTILICA